MGKVDFSQDSAPTVDFVLDHSELGDRRIEQGCGGAQRRVRMNIAQHRDRITAVAAHCFIVRLEFLNLIGPGENH